MATTRWNEGEECEDLRASYEDLQKLWRLLLDCLLERMQEPNPSAAIADVARKFLRDNNVLFDHAHKVNPVTALQYLADIEIPFPRQ